MEVPTEGEVAWVVEDAAGGSIEQPYCRIRIKELSAAPAGDTRPQAALAREE